MRKLSATVPLAQAERGGIAQLQDLASSTQQNIVDLSW